MPIGNKTGPILDWDHCSPILQQAGYLSAAAAADAQTKCTQTNKEDKKAAAVLRAAAANYSDRPQPSAPLEKSDTSVDSIELDSFD